MDDVERVFRHLVDVLADEHPDRISQPLQASEIYQTLLPYRRYRSALLFDTNQDYEMAILRLLAGEHGYASVEPPQAQAELKAEADSVNPNPSAIREYAGIKVFLNVNLVREMIDGREAYAPPDAYQEDEEPDTSIEEAEIESFVGVRYELEEDDEATEDQSVTDTPSDVESDEVADEVFVDTERDQSEVSADAEEDVSASEEDRQDDEEIVESSEPSEPAAQLTGAKVVSEEEIESDEQLSEETPEISLPSLASPNEKMVPSGADLECVHCGEALPPERKVVFCPFCGINQTVRECAECGAKLEDGWVFCVECGAGESDRK